MFNKKKETKKDAIDSTKPNVELCTIKTYPVPETKEDYLALIQCLKDTGVTDISGLEVRASRL